MAIQPMQAKSLLYKAMSDLGQAPPIFKNSKDNSQLWISEATISITYQNRNELLQTFLSTATDSLPIAEDFAARMALQGLRSHYKHNNTITTYLTDHIYKNTKIAWIDAFQALQKEFDKAIQRNVKLCRDLYETKQQVNNILNQHKHILQFEKDMARKNMSKTMNEMAQLKAELEMSRTTIQYFMHEKDENVTQSYNLQGSTSALDDLEDLDIEGIQREMAELMKNDIKNT